MKFQNGNSYIGEYKEGLKEGFGTYNNKDNTYIGEFTKDKNFGQVKLTLSNSMLYDGNFEYDKMNGFGTLSWSNTYDSKLLTYYGNFKNNQ